MPNPDHGPDRGPPLPVADLPSMIALATHPVIEVLDLVELVPSAARPEPEIDINNLLEELVELPFEDIELSLARMALVPGLTLEHAIDRLRPRARPALSELEVMALFGRMVVERASRLSVGGLGKTDLTIVRRALAACAGFAPVLARLATDLEQIPASTDSEPVRSPGHDVDLCTLVLLGTLTVGQIVWAIELSRQSPKFAGTFTIYAQQLHTIADLMFDL